MMSDRPRVSLADFDEFFDGWIARRVMVDKRDPRARAKLTAVDQEFVAWFDGRGIELVVDRDTLTHDRIVVKGDNPLTESYAPFPATTYIVELSFGSPGRPYLIEKQRCVSEEIADREYHAAWESGAWRVALIRQTPDERKIVKSWEQKGPTE